MGSEYIWTGVVSETWSIAANWSSVAGTPMLEIEKDSSPITDFVPDSVVTRRGEISGEWMTYYCDHSGATHGLPLDEWLARAVWPSNVTTYTLPEPKHWSRWIILATAIGILASAVISYLS